MVIKAKREVVNLNGNERIVMKRLEKKIDQELKKKMEILQQGREVKVQLISFSRRYHTNSVDYALEEKYRRAGWEVKVERIHDDSKNSPAAMKTFLVFKITPSYG